MLVDYYSSLTYECLVLDSELSTCWSTFRELYSDVSVRFKLPYRYYVWSYECISAA